MKVLPETFDEIPSVRFTPSRPLRGQDWKTMVERMHHLWATSRAVSSGVRIFGDGFEGGTDPGYDDFSIPIRMSRPVAGDDLIARVDMYADNGVIEVTPYVDGASVAPTLTIAGEGVIDWTDSTITIDESSVGAEIVHFRIERIGGEIMHVQIAEATIDDLDSTDIP